MSRAGRVRIEATHETGDTNIAETSSIGKLVVAAVNDNGAEKALLKELWPI